MKIQSLELFYLKSKRIAKVIPCHPGYFSEHTASSMNNNYTKWRLLCIFLNFP